MTEENNDLAGRGARLGAVIIDALIIFPILFGIAKATGFWDTMLPRLANGIPLSMEENIVAFLVGQTLFPPPKRCHFLPNHGQTIGKRIMKVKIVEHGRQAGRYHQTIFTPRYLVFSFVSQIPVAGGSLTQACLMYCLFLEKNADVFMTELRVRKSWRQIDY